jgi:hypothetical protein
LAAFTAFAAMTPEADAADAGPNVKMIGRWTDLAGGNGICICGMVHVSKQSP